MVVCAGGFVLGGGGWWWVYFGWCREVVGLFWVMVDGGWRVIFRCGEWWWWVVVGGGRFILGGG